MKIHKIDVHIESPNLNNTFKHLAFEANQLHKSFKKYSKENYKNFNQFQLSKDATRSVAITEQFQEILVNLENRTQAINGQIIVPDQFPILHKRSIEYGGKN